MFFCAVHCGNWTQRDIVLLGGGRMAARVAGRFAGVPISARSVLNFLGVKQMSSSSFFVTNQISALMSDRKEPATTWRCENSRVFCKLLMAKFLQVDAQFQALNLLGCTFLAASGDTGAAGAACRSSRYGE